MSKTSERVKKWRASTKIKIVEAMGGSCQICGYNKCYNALDLHHLDSNEKDFSFGKIRANPQSWRKIVQELRKCILLCCLCHREIHANVAKIPETFVKFNEEFSDYKTLKNTKEFQNLFDKCKCGNDKPIKNKYCSRSCSAKSNKFDWSKVDLLEELKTKNAIQISEELGISDSSVYKRRNKLLIGN